MVVRRVTFVRKIRENFLKFLGRSVLVFLETLNGQKVKVLGSE
jgi:hypothetical protein